MYIFFFLTRNVFKENSIFKRHKLMCDKKYMDIADRDFLIATYIFKVYRQTRSTVFKVKRGRANSSKKS